MNYKIYLTIIIFILFTFGFIYHDKAVYDNENKKRHFYKGLIQLCFFGLVMVNTSVYIGIFFMALYWALFDSIYNKAVLKKDFFYVGVTSFIDKAFLKVFGKKAGEVMLSIKVLVAAIFGWLGIKFQKKDKINLDK